MRCRRIRRELLWLARFGELGPSSQPHLDHLAGCRPCRDEVGYDREMVRQLRIALAARIEAMEPSPRAWETILERARTPEPTGAPAWWSRWRGLAGRLRTATAMAGTGLALLLALHMEVVPGTTPATDAGTEAATSVLEQVPRLPTGRTALVAYMRQSEAQGTVSRPDPESELTGVPVRRGSASAAAPAEAADEPSGTGLRVTFRALGTAAPIPADAPGESGAPAPARAPVSAPVITEAGEPS